MRPWLRWKLRVWGAKLHRNACETMVAISRKHWEEDGGVERWDTYQFFCARFQEAVEDVQKRVSERL
jgi:hypothetical protein